MNGSDCGMFACKYAEFASRGKNVFNFNQVIYLKCHISFIKKSRKFF